MVVGMGLWGKDAKSNLLVKAWQMRRSARWVIKDWGGQKKVEKQLEKQQLRHNIKEIGGDLGEGKLGGLLEKEDALVENAAFHSHRLVTLDLLLLYGILQYCNDLVTLLHKEEGELTKDERQVKGALLSVIKKHELSEQQAKDGLWKVLKDTEADLQKDSKIILSLQNVADEKFGVALTQTELIALKIKVVRYLKMRWEMVWARKGLQREDKDLEALKPIIDHIDLIAKIRELQRQRASENSIKRTVDRFLRGIDKDEMDFVAAADSGRKNVYELLKNDLLIMKLMAHHLTQDKHKTETMAQKHEIPLSMATLDLERKKAILKRLQGSLQEERQDIKQTWDLTLKTISNLKRKGDMALQK